MTRRPDPGMAPGVGAADPATGAPPREAARHAGAPLYLAGTCLLDAPPLTVIDAAAHAGFAGVGLRLHPSPRLPYHPVVGNAALIGAIEAALAATGLRLLDALSFYLQPDFSLARMLPALELAARLRMPWLLAQGDDPEPARLATHFASFCAAAHQFGLGVALEFVPARPLATLHQALALLDSVQPAHAGILVDTLHLVRSGGDAAQLRQVAHSAPQRLAFAQLSDGMLGPGEDTLALGRQTAGVRALPGAGNLPLRALVAALPEGLPLSVEVLQPTSGPQASLTPRQWARLCLSTTRTLLDTPP